MLKTKRKKEKEKETDAVRTPSLPIPASEDELFLGILDRVSKENALFAIENGLVCYADTLLFDAEEYDTLSAAALLLNFYKSFSSK